MQSTPGEPVRNMLMASDSLKDASLSSPAAAADRPCHLDRAGPRGRARRRQLPAGRRGSGPDRRRDRENGGTSRPAFQAPSPPLDDDAAVVAGLNDELGPIAILVNNGGIASRGRFVADTDPAELERS